MCLYGSIGITGETHSNGFNKVKIPRTPQETKPGSLPIIISFASHNNNPRVQIISSKKIKLDEN